MYASRRKSAWLPTTTGITDVIAAVHLLRDGLIDRLAVPFVAACAQAIAPFGANALTVPTSPMAVIWTLGWIGVVYWPLFGRDHWCLA
jgi:hypothetical protein